MLSRFLITGLALALAGCSRSNDSKLVGRWQLPRTAVKLTFRSDHTWQIEGQSPGVIGTGSWRCEGDQLITLTGKLHDNEVRYTVVALDRKKFVSRMAGYNDTITYERVE